MKKAIVTKVTKFEKKDDYGNTSFSIEFNNGDKGFYSTKSEEQSKFIVQKEAEYNIEEKTGKTGKVWFKITLPQSETPFQGGGFKGKPQVDPKVQMISFAMSYTKDLIVGGKVSIDHIEKVFNQIHALMIGKL